MTQHDPRLAGPEEAAATPGGCTRGAPHAREHSQGQASQRRYHAQSGECAGTQSLALKWRLLACSNTTTGTAAHCAARLRLATSAARAPLVTGGGTETSANLRKRVNSCPNLCRHDSCLTGPGSATSLHMAAHQPSAICVHPSRARPASSLRPSRHTLISVRGGRHQGEKGCSRLRLLHDGDLREHSPTTVDSPCLGWDSAVGRRQVV